MKKISMVKLGLTALLVCASTTAMADDSLSVSGYFRAGTGIELDSSEASDNVSEKNEKYLGRMGNEYNTWVSLDLHKSITGKNGAKVELTADAYGWLQDPETSGPWAGDNGYGADSGAFYVGELSAKFSNLDFLPKTSTLKVGQFGLSEDVHALDYKFKTIAGTGVSYKNENKQLTFVVNDTRNTTAIDGEYKIGNIETKLTLAQSLTNDDTSEQVMLAYNQKSFFGMGEGTTKYVVQGGLGTVATGEKLSANYVTDKDDEGARFIIDAHKETAKWIVNPVLWTEYTSDHLVELNDDADSAIERTYNDVKTVSLTAGGRVTQKLTNNLQLMYEGFVNSTQNFGGDLLKDGVTYKIAAGPAIQVDMGEFVRPTARFTLTYIGGDKDITGFTKTGEVRLGSQFEAWF